MLKLVWRVAQATLKKSRQPASTVASWSSCLLVVKKESPLARILLKDASFQIDEQETDLFALLGEEKQKRRGI